MAKNEIIISFDQEYTHRNPIPNKYRHVIDTGFDMLECPECEGRIQYNPFSWAVGDKGFAFCPYCGADLRRDKDGNA